MRTRAVLTLVRARMQGAFSAALRRLGAADARVRVQITRCLNYTLSLRLTVEVAGSGLAKPVQDAMLSPSGRSTTLEELRALEPMELRSSDDLAPLYSIRATAD